MELILVIIIYDNGNNKDQELIPYKNIFKKLNETRRKNKYTKLLQIKTNREKENTKKENKKKENKEKKINKNKDDIKKDNKEKINKNKADKKKKIKIK